MNVTIRNTRPTLLTIACGAVLALGAVSVSTAGPAFMSDQVITDSQQPVGDTWITTKVKAKLATTDDVGSMDLNVNTVNGVVHLTGNVDSDVERKKAVAAAKSIKGVKEVDASGLMAGDKHASMDDDHSGTDSEQPVTDTWITTKVKAKLATTDNVKSVDVSVDTVNGVVHLTGNVDSDMERDKAVVAAKGIKGVKEVDASGLMAGDKHASIDDDHSDTDSEQPVTDTWITTKVKAELATTDNVKSMDVSVDTVNGVVHLTGNVHSDMERDKAVAAAKSVKGVKSVDASGLKASANPASMDNDQKATDSQQPVSDTWITTKVKAELATTDNVDSMDVGVKTVNGVVHLTGNVSSDVERKKAVAAARSVKGVNTVDASGLKSME